MLGKRGGILDFDLIKEYVNTINNLQEENALLRDKISNRDCVIVLLVIVIISGVILI